MSQQEPVIENGKWESISLAVASLDGKPSDKKETYQIPTLSFLKEARAQLSASPIAEPSTYMSKLSNIFGTKELRQFPLRWLSAGMVNYETQKLDVDAFIALWYLPLAGTVGAQALDVVAVEANEAGSPYASKYSEFMRLLPPLIREIIESVEKQAWAIGQIADPSMGEYKKRTDKFRIKLLASSGQAKQTRMKKQKEAEPEPMPEPVPKVDEVKLDTAEEDESAIDIPYFDSMFSSMLMYSLGGRAYTLAELSGLKRRMKIDKSSLVSKLATYLDKNPTAMDLPLAPEFVGRKDRPKISAISKMMDEVDEEYVINASYPPLTRTTRVGYHQTRMITDPETFLRAGDEQYVTAFHAAAGKINLLSLNENKDGVEMKKFDDLTVPAGISNLETGERALKPNNPEFKPLGYDTNVMRVFKKTLAYAEIGMMEGRVLPKLVSALKRTVDYVDDMVQNKYFGSKDLEAVKLRFKKQFEVARKTYSPPVPYHVFSASMKRWTSADHPEMIKRDPYPFHLFIEGKNTLLELNLDIVSKMTAQGPIGEYTRELLESRGYVFPWDDETEAEIILDEHRIKGVTFQMDASAGLFYQEKHIAVWPDEMAAAQQILNDCADALEKPRKFWEAYNHVALTKLAIKPEVYGVDKATRNIFAAQTAPGLPANIMAQMELTRLKGKNFPRHLAGFSFARGGMDRLLTEWRMIGEELHIGETHYTAYADNIYALTKTKSNNLVLMSWDGATMEATHAPAFIRYCILDLIENTFGVPQEIVRFLETNWWPDASLSEISMTRWYAQFQQLATESKAQDQGLIVGGKWFNYLITILPYMHAYGTYLFGTRQYKIPGIGSGVPLTFYFNMKRALAATAPFHFGMVNAPPDSDAAAFGIKRLHYSFESKGETRHDEEAPSVTDGVTMPKEVREHFDEWSFFLKLERATNPNGDVFKDLDAGLIVPLDLLGYSAKKLEIGTLTCMMAVLDYDRLLGSMLYEKNDPLQDFELTGTAKEDALRILRWIKLKTLYIIGGWAYTDLAEVIRNACVQISIDLKGEETFLKNLVDHAKGDTFRGVDEPEELAASTVADRIVQSLLDSETDAAPVYLGAEFVTAILQSPPLPYMSEVIKIMAPPEFYEEFLEYYNDNADDEPALRKMAPHEVKPKSPDLEIGTEAPRATAELAAGTMPEITKKKRMTQREENTLFLKNKPRGAKQQLDPSKVMDALVPLLRTTTLTLVAQDHLLLEAYTRERKGAQLFHILADTLAIEMKVDKASVIPIMKAEPAKTVLREGIARAKKLLITTTKKGVPPLEMEPPFT